MRKFTKMLSVLLIVMLSAFMTIQGRAQTTLLTEGWESAADGSTVPPTGWGIDLLGYANITYYLSSGTFPTVAPFEGARLVDFKSFSYGTGYTNRLKRTTAISTVGYSNITVDWEWYRDNGYQGYANEGVFIDWSTDGVTWNQAGAIWVRWATTNFWELETQALPAGAANQPTLYVAFRFLSQFGNDCHLDIMHVKGLQTGTLTGNVKTCPTNANLAGATVYVTAGSPPTNYSGITNAAGNYTIAGIPTGLGLPVNATATGYVQYGPTPVTILANQTTTFNFCMNPLPAYLSGVVTNGTTGAPVVGAKVQSSATNFTYSTGPNGAYSLSIFPAYTGTVWVNKDGFDMYQIATNTYTPPTNYAMNVGLLETTNPPAQPFTAALNSGQTAVNLNWGIPQGKYQLIYDDGIEDAFAVWQAEGNLDAVKITPVGYPATLLGCMINIGKSSDYILPGHPVTFKVGVFDATGPGGMPGTQIAPYTDFVVSATTFGWYDYPAYWGSGIVINSGSVYIVTKQVGAFPNAAGIAMDTTSNQLRSFQKFVTGNGPWVPAGGNLEIRAHMMGSGGPLLGDSPENNQTIVGYQVWRFLQGQESLGPVGWTSVGTPTATNIVDNSWPSLPCQSYRWAVEAQYQNNRWSGPTFSNALGKCWTANVIVNVTLSCTTADPSNAIVTLSRHNPGTPPPTYDSVYVRVTGATGAANFNNIYKGVYDLTVTDFDYGTFSQTNITIMGDMTLNATLLQVKTPPAWLPNGGINNVSLLATWNPPHLSVPIFTENWASGNFTANGWTKSGSAAGNWIVVAFGNPSPSAEFNWTPQQTNYDAYLTSKVLTGLHSPTLKLNYDIYLSNFGTTNLNTLAVELWNGTSWVALKTYSNTGNMPWTTEHLDITSVTNSSFQIRFHAAGIDSFDINNWNVDNISVTAEGPTGPNPCIIGYNFYLNNALSGFTPDTFYNIPPGQVVYGQTFTGCVAAIYGSGFSTKICQTFISKFLCPVTNLTALAVTNAAYLTWTKPQCLAGSSQCFIYDDGSEENGWAINPGFVDWLGNKFPITAGLTGSLKSFDILWYNNGAATLQPFQIDVFNMAGVLQGSSQTFTVPVPAPATFMTVTLASDIPFNGPFYGMLKWNNFTGNTHWLGFDQNGPYAATNLGYYYDGTTFTQISVIGGGGAGTFTERACGFVFGEDKMVSIGPDIAPVDTKSYAAVQPGVLSQVPAGSPAIDSHDYGIMDPDSPMAGTGLIGYNVYQKVGNNDIFHHYVPGPDSLKTYVYNLNPGLQCFDVTGKYDLTTYGFPGTFGESLNENPGPACVNLVFGFPLPFMEPWDGGSLGYQQWTSGNNWLYTPATGNPAPSANFTWQPIMANYNSSLTSPTIDASAWTCAAIWFDFDYKLDDRDANGTEKIEIEAMWDNKWHQKGELKNDGSVNWTPQHIDISGVKGMGFQVRFRANGTNTQHILNWYFDNIHIYGMCNAPTDLNKTQSHDTIHLTWTPPLCGQSGQNLCFIFDDGSEENGWAINPGFNDWLGNLYPIGAAVAGNLQSFDILWYNNGSGTQQPWSIDVFSQAGVLLGSSQTFAVPVPAPATFMNIALNNEIPFSGPFYGMVHWNNFTGATHWLGFDENGPYASQNLGYYYDGTAFQPIQVVGGGNPGTFTERACAFVYGEDKVVTLGPAPTPGATHIPVAPGILSSIPAGSPAYDSHDNPVMEIRTNGSDSSQLMGYNVFRYDDVAAGIVDWHKLNQAGVVSATSYMDVVGLDTMQYGMYKYFVTAVFNNSVNGTFLCESLGSDTVTVQFPAVGIPQVTAGSILIYPNPANDYVNVKSDYNISRIDVVNFIGQTVITENTGNTKLVKINTSSLTAGVYFIKATTTNGIRTVKITIAR
jgi:hypothetical protein